MNKNRECSNPSQWNDSHFDYVPSMTSTVWKKNRCHFSETEQMASSVLCVLRKFTQTLKPQKIKHSKENETCLELSES